MGVFEKRMMKIGYIKPLCTSNPQICEKYFDEKRLLATLCHSVVFVCLFITPLAW